MFAIDHAATALLIKRRFPEQPIAPLLISVQWMELLWVGFNLTGLERTTTEPTVRSVADIHLAFIPWSHSVAMSLGYAALAWVVLSILLRRPTMLSADVPGPESLLANRPTAIVLVILAQIVVTLALVGLFSGRSPSPGGPLENRRRPL